MKKMHVHSGTNNSADTSSGNELHLKGRWGILGGWGSWCYSFTSGESFRDVQARCFWSVLSEILVSTVLCLPEYEQQIKSKPKSRSRYMDVTLSFKHIRNRVSTGCYLVACWLPFIHPVIPHLTELFPLNGCSLSVFPSLHVFSASVTVTCTLSHLLSHFSPPLLSCPFVLSPSSRIYMCKKNDISYICYFNLYYYKCFTETEMKRKGFF